MRPLLTALQRHTVALAAVLLALAVGIALGAGPLGGGDDARDAHGDPASAASGRGDGGDDPAATADGYAEELVDANAARLYAGGLDGHATAVLAMPGADPATVEALQDQVSAAGGAMTGTYTAGSDLVDPEAQDRVDAVGSQLAGQLADPRLDPAATTYERAGALLGLAMATTQVTSVRADPAAVTARTALGAAGLLTSPSDVRSAPLVLVVLPPGEEGAPSSLAARTLLTGLVNGLGTAAAGVVVVGDADSAADGELAALREGALAGPVSTVDGVEGPVGRVTAVLALVAVVGGTTGSFGASGADGVVPLG